MRGESRLSKDMVVTRRVQTRFAPHRPLVLNRVLAGSHVTTTLFARPNSADDLRVSSEAPYEKLLAWTQWMDGSNTLTASR
jgi:hypothetical protein